MGRRKYESHVSNIKVWQIGLYLRLSKEDQAKLSGALHSNSIENQDKILESYIQRLKETYPDEIFEVEGIYIDDGLTGTNTDKRDQFNKMVDSIIQGRINCVLFKDLSRMFRNHTEQSHFLELFCPEYNVRVISINNNIDTYVNPDVVYGYDIAFTGISNDRYCQTISKNITQTFNMKRQRGEFIGAFAPYGYKKDKIDKNKLVIDDEAALVVRDIFKMFSGGEYSKEGIARMLNDSGIPSPAEYKKLQGLKYSNPQIKHQKSYWSATTISNILSNQMYIGHMVQGKTKKINYKIDKYLKIPSAQWEVVENTHESIIDKKTFKKVQELLELNTRVKSSPEEKGKLNLFAGLIKCGDCGRAMHRKKNKHSPYAQFVCRTYTSISKTQCTSRHAVREMFVAEAVLKAIQWQVVFMENISELIEQAEKSTLVRTDNSRLNIQYKKAYDDLEAARKIADNLYVDFKGDLITEEQYRRLKKSYLEEVERQSFILENLERQIRELKERGTAEPDCLKEFKENRNIMALNRTLVTELIKEILIHENKTVEIRFNFQNQLENPINWL